MFKVHVNYVDCKNTKQFTNYTEALRYYCEIIDGYDGEFISVIFAECDVVRLVHRFE